MKRKILASVLATCILLSGISTGCAKGGASSEAAGNNSKAGTGSGKTSITFLNSKGEIADSLKKAVDAYNSSNKDGITVEVSTIGAGSSAYEALMTKYSAGNAPTIMMTGANDLTSFKNNIIDLSGEKWVSDTANGMLDAVRDDKVIFAFPFCVEGCGLIYNKATIEKATKEKFDPKAIKTRSDLENLYKKIQAGGVAPVEISKDDWSLADHFTMTSYGDQSEDFAKTQSYMADLKAGKVDLDTNKAFNGLLQTFDLNKQYNIYKKSPLSSDYNSTDPQNIATGKVAFWFNGEWVWPNIKQFLSSGANDEYGFLPVPISDNASDYGNSQIPVGVTKYLAIDKKCNNASQQDAAKKFLNWFVYDPKGQDYLVNQMGIIPAFKNISISPSDPLSKSIKSYLDEKKTVYFNASLPADHGKNIGSFMQQYLAGKIDKKTLAQKSINYWKTAK